MQRGVYYETSASCFEVNRFIRYHRETTTKYIYKPDIKATFENYYFRRMESVYAEFCLKHISN